jgi:amino acid transporter
MILIVLTGTLASLQAAVISAARIGYSMGSDRVLPPFLARVHERFGTPFVGTIFFGLLNVVFIWIFLFAGSVASAFSSIVSALGILAGLFYALTAITAVWYYRRTVLSSFGDAVLGGVLPLFGAVFLLGVIFYSVASGATTATVLVAGLGSAAIGIPLAIVSAVWGRSAFFKQKPQSQAAAAR